MLGVTESWLNEEFSDEDIAISGYWSEREDRYERPDLRFSDKNKGGAVVLYIHKSLSYIRRDDLESRNVELLRIKKIA